MALALIYYARRKKIQSFGPALQPSSLLAEADDCSGHSAHTHTCAHTSQHLFAHLVGLWMPSFFLAAGAAFATFSGEELSKLDKDHYLNALPIAMTVAIFATLGDVTLHNTFLTQGEHDHGNFLNSYVDVMFKKPYALYQDERKCQAIATSWIKWGTFFAHISELIFAIDIGLKVLIDKPMEYLTDSSLPTAALSAASWLLAISGAAIHCHSEAKAFDEIHEQQQAIFNLKFANLDEPYLRYLKIPFLILTVMDALWHSLPEFLGLPETLIFPLLGDNALIKTLSFASIGALLAFPDFISNVTLGARAVEMFNKPASPLLAPSSPLLLESPPSRSFASHINSPVTLSKSCSFP